MGSLKIFTPDYKLQKNHKNIRKIRDPDLMSHCLLHEYPIRVAISLKIPLVLHGENSAYEYSGDNSYMKTLDHKWFEEYAEEKTPLNHKTILIIIKLKFLTYHLIRI